MAVYYSPNGNIEIWENKPEGYFTVDEWQAAHPPQTDELTPEEMRDQRIEMIKAELAQIDFDSVRPLRAELAGAATKHDKQKLAELEKQAEAARKELAELGC